jgi:hypothetical protein
VQCFDFLADGISVPPLLLRACPPAQLQKGKSS